MPLRDTLAGSCAALLYVVVLATPALADDDIGSGARAFAQLGQELPTANSYRTASGAPGHEYWQQQADFRIEATLDAETRSLDATATITYRNNSPDALRYLWLQLDQNRFRADSLDQRSRDSSSDRVSYGDLRQQQALADNQHGYRELSFRDARGGELPFTVVDTLVRVDLPNPLESGEAISIDVAKNRFDRVRILD